MQNATNKISLSVIVFLHIASLVKTDFMNRKYRMMITYLCISSTVVSHFRTNKTMILTTPFSSLLFSFSFARKLKRLSVNWQHVENWKIPVFRQCFLIRNCLHLYTEIKAILLTKLQSYQRGMCDVSPYNQLPKQLTSEQVTLTA